MKYLITMLATVFTHFLAFFKGSQSATYKIKAEAEEEAREYEKAGSEALIEGLQREHKEADKPVDVKNRADFE